MPSSVEDNDPSSISHRQVLINNEQCLVRSFPELSQSLNQKNLDVEKNKRKKINDSVGPRHLDTVLLDTRSVNGGTEYCDAIIYSNNTPPAPLTGEQYGKISEPKYPEDGQSQSVLRHQGVFNVPLYF